MDHKSNLKNWMKTNEKYFEANPKVLQSLMENPNFVASFNDRMLNRRNKLAKRIARMERRATVPAITAETTTPTKRGLRLPKLPSLSSINSRLNQANDLLQTIKSLTGGM